MENKKIYVTKPSLAKLENFVPYLENIWTTHTLTNSGPYHQEFEKQLCEYLRVPYVSLFNNATIALMTALKALDAHGEVITTPFTFVATSHSLAWNNIKPVFVDIDPISMNLDPTKIETKITENTTAILAVHCYGHPCDVDKIEKIASKHSLKVIYDAAHAFGVECHCGSILNHGDLSVLSFHATKVFNTFEGGAVVSRNLETKQKIDRIKNFGIIDETSVSEIGLNGKMSEINAAFGLLQLKCIDDFIDRRREIANLYNNLLNSVRGITIPNRDSLKRDNYSYYPILINNETQKNRDHVYYALQANNIFARRYFYPLMTNLPPYQDTNINLPNAETTAQQVLCLPIYPDLSDHDAKRIAETLRRILCA